MSAKVEADMSKRSLRYRYPHQVGQFHTINDVVECHFEPMGCLISETLIDAACKIENIDNGRHQTALLRSLHFQVHCMVLTLARFLVVGADRRTASKIQ